MIYPLSDPGTVEKVSSVTVRHICRLEGLGFVVLSDADAARPMPAVMGMNFNHSPLRVREAQSRGRSGGDGGGGGAVLRAAIAVPMHPSMSMAELARTE